MSRVIGIDLGTTNSCVAVIDGGKPVVIPNAGGYKTTPSMFAVSQDGKRLVGHLAKRQAITNARNTVYSSKRLIGRRFDSEEVQKSVDLCPFEIVRGPNDDPRITIAGKMFTCPEGPGTIDERMQAKQADLRGIVSPHIDLARGGPTFAWAYKQIAERSDAEVFVVLGTGRRAILHYPGQDLLCPLYPRPDHLSYFRGTGPFYQYYGREHGGIQL